MNEFDALLIQVGLQFACNSVEKSSTTRTSAPRFSRPSTRCEPRNDAPPVTSTLFWFQFNG